MRNRSRGFAESWGIRLRQLRLWLDYAGLGLRRGMRCSWRNQPMEPAWLAGYM